LKWPFPLQSVNFIQHVDKKDPISNFISDIQKVEMKKQTKTCVNFGSSIPKILISE